MELGYSRRRPDSARFELGPGVLSLGHPVLAGLLRFGRLALPHITELTRKFHRTPVELRIIGARWAVLARQCSPFPAFTPVGGSAMIVGLKQEPHPLYCR